MKRIPRRSRFALLGGAVYLVAIAVILMWPTHVDGVNGELFRPLMDVLAQWGIPAWRTYPWIEFISNMVLFAPFGVFIALAFGRRGWWIAALSGFIVSSLAELVQEFFLPGRTGDIRDVVSNTSGTIIGALLYLGVARLVGRSRARRTEVTSVDTGGITMNNSTATATAAHAAPIVEPTAR